MAFVIIALSLLGSALGYLMLLFHETYLGVNGQLQISLGLCANDDVLQ